MEPRLAAKALQAAIKDPQRPMTIADASAASGLALRDAESGLHWLTSAYRGHLRVTEDGDLVHVFPAGFTKPWETRDAIDRALAKTGRTMLGVGRFVVRAWILVVLLGYTAIFVAMLIALAFARSSGNDRDRGSGFGVVGGMFRVLGDALFWTFRPFSPLYYAPLDYGYANRGRKKQPRSRSAAEGIPFYEKVNRFVFGPETPPEDPNAMRARVVSEIRANQGRIGLADVMRVTGLPRDQADPLMARLMLDFEGSVEVADGGGIFYRFKELRRTATTEDAKGKQMPVWQRPHALEPLTGNDAGANVIVSLLNGFNLLMSAWVLEHGMTIQNMLTLFSKHPPVVMPDPSLPIALGVVPLVFSIGLFLAPAARALFRSRAKTAHARENARLSILREVLTHAPKKEPVSDEALRAAYRKEMGVEPSSKEITRRVVDLGGDVDTGPNGEIRYRFADLEAEAEALEDERAQASDEEAKLGRVVFASDR